MATPIKATAVLLAGLWSGALLFVGFILTPYVFALAGSGDANVPHTDAAAALVGPLLYGSDVAGLVVCVVLIACLVLLRVKNQTPLGGRFFLCEIALVIAGICSSINYWGLSPRLNAAQAMLTEQYGGFHLAEKTDPLYLSFTALHEWATILFMVVFLCTVVCLICFSQFQSARREVA